jgi:UDP-glucuronate 4-epimerase
LKILVTGAAGFIGMHTCKALVERGDEVVGIDNLNDYYDVDLKKKRLVQIELYPNFRFIKIDIADKDALFIFFETEKFDKVINLAAQAGVRYSITNPQEYVESNLVGFINILEGCRHNAVQHLVYASSSSVYGGNTKMPFSEHDNVDHPVSLYAATKKSNELMAHTYSHIYNLPTTGLRFFTVYGPWGRPDMAPFIFVNAIEKNEPIKIFNHGNMQRDFTYVDDIVEAVVRVVDKNATAKDGYDTKYTDSSCSNVPYRIFNIGNSSPVPLMEFIDSLESAIGKKAEKNYLPMQDGDVPATYANTQMLNDWIGFSPSTPLKEGVKKFVDWYVSHYK